MAFVEGGCLYLVATPIGNLADITLRALSVLGSVDLIAAEDTRKSARLLAHHGIVTRMVALHEHNERQQAKVLLDKLSEGRSVAYITDAGTPAISDPGSRFARMAMERGLPVVPIPGPNAAVTAFCASGVEDSRFFFYGFMPASGSARRKVLENLSDFAHPLIFYEAPHRIMECISDMAQILGDRRIVVARELTKIHESIVALSLSETWGWLDSDSNRQKGEFVLVVDGAPVKNEIDAKTMETLTVLLGVMPVSQAVLLTVKLTGARKKDLYALALQSHKANDAL
ncbi:MAG: 16S rRNA (cytidine(1402)-2'-O)-methyltransferase [Pseudomonadota bacterium]|nr:16S rRNA (cytidine(1402)-2'-O)-methyltransferase [Pseudomonadota bacterium]